MPRAVGASRVRFAETGLDGGKGVGDGGSNSRVSSGGSLPALACLVIHDAPVLGAMAVTAIAVHPLLHDIQLTRLGRNTLRFRDIREELIAALKALRVAKGGGYVVGRSKFGMSFTGRPT